MVKAINEGIRENYPWKNVVNECKDLMKDLGIIKIKHIYREASKCADKLELGKEVDSSLHEDYAPLIAVRGATAFKCEGDVLGDLETGPSE
ncbi:Ribonuclease H domain [Dillenia turbinata]|uniref:Ribonuclease H domain n=1 Tax=Dillenia turbinata TaxID=194707 RepID=A0AAN8VM07_9MAGN